MEEDLCNSCGNFDWDCDGCSKGHDEKIIESHREGKPLKHCIDYFMVKQNRCIQFILIK